MANWNDPQPTRTGFGASPSLNIAGDRATYDQGLRRHRVGRGDIGIGAVIDVEHGGLRTFEQDALAGGAQPGESLPDVLRERQDLRRQIEQFGLAFYNLFSPFSVGDVINN